MERAASCSAAEARGAAVSAVAGLASCLCVLLAEYWFVDDAPVSRLLWYAAGAAVYASLCISVAYAWPSPVGMLLAAMAANEDDVELMRVAAPPCDVVTQRPLLEGTAYRLDDDNAACVSAESALELLLHRRAQNPLTRGAIVRIARVRVVLEGAA